MKDTFYNCQPPICRWLTLFPHELPFTGSAAVVLVATAAVTALHDNQKEDIDGSFSLAGTWNVAFQLLEHWDNLFSQGV